MAGYYPKIGGALAAISYRRGVAWGVDGFPAMSLKSWRNRGESGDVPRSPVSHSNYRISIPFCRPISPIPRGGDIILNPADH